MKKLIFITALSICNITIAMDTTKNPIKVGSEEHISSIAREHFVTLKQNTVKILVGEKNSEKINFFLLHNEPSLSDRARQDLSNAIAQEVQVKLPKPHHPATTLAITQPAKL